MTIKEETTCETKTIIETRIDKLEFKQKEQDKRIEELEEKVKLAAMGFPIGFFGV